MERNRVLMLEPETTISAAARRMAQSGTGAAMVVRDEVLLGIFTERDALFRVIARGLDPSEVTLGDVMTTDPRTVGPEDTYGYALVMMHEGGFRHAPVVENGKPIGIVSSRNAMDPDMEEFASEANRREYLTRHR